MYGWINRSIGSLIISRYGKDTWDVILRKAGLDDKGYDWVRYEYYPDEYTYNIIHSASIVLGITTEQLLEIYGGYFIQYVRSNGDVFNITTDRNLEYYQRMHKEQNPL